MKTIVYTLDHVYEIDDAEIIKFIGVFSTIENAQNAIASLKNQSGFRDLPEDCFQISENIIDNIGWKEGFIKMKDAF